MALRQEWFELVCGGPLVIHHDDSFECLDPDCQDVDTDHGPLTTPCWMVFEEECPRCGPLWD